MPTDGLLFQAELGHCSSCEPERQAERRIAMQRAEAESRLASLQADLLAAERERCKALLASGKLKPVEPRASVEGAVLAG